MYLHSSVNNPKFLNDKKLNLLNAGIITIGQFVNLIDLDDPYTVIGPAVVAKDSIDEFIKEWKDSTINLKTMDEAFMREINPETIIQKLPVIQQVFPEIEDLVNDLNEKLKNTSCALCVKNKALLQIISRIKKLSEDGRPLGLHANFIKAIIDKYFPVADKLVNESNVNEFDFMWIKPESLIALGADLIEGLTSCFDCCKKHLGRAKVLYEEWHMGYPDHGTLMYNEFVEANKTIEEGYTLYWDSLSQLDMASCELVGSNFGVLEKPVQLDMIELANKIRAARLLFQEDSTKVPDWDKLRLEVQKLQNKLNKMKVQK